MGWEQKFKLNKVLNFVKSKFWKEKQNLLVEIKKIL